MVGRSSALLFSHAICRKVRPFSPKLSYERKDFLMSGVRISLGRPARKAVNWRSERMW